MKAIISGSSGFIGKALSKRLKELGFDVIGVPRDIFYDPMALQELFIYNKPDYIFNLASYGNMNGQDELTSMINANILGTVSMLSASLAIDYKAFINISTSSVTLNHQTMYSATKASSEHIARAFADEYKKPIVNVRPYSIYGPSEAEFRFIPTVFNSCLNNTPMDLSPNAVHDWTYIDDFIEGLIDIAKNIKQLKGATIGIGTGKATANKDVIRLIEEITNKKAVINKQKNLRSFDNKDWKADPTDYLVKTTLRTGLTNIYKWYTKN